MRKKSKNRSDRLEVILKGQPISPGIAIGKAFILDEDYIETPKERIPAHKIQDEIDKFKQAIHNTIRDLQTIIDQVGMRVSARKREIFDAHLMILEDAQIIEQTISEIKNKQINADYAYFNIMRNYQRALSASSDSYLKERAADIRDMKRRVIRRIQGVQRDRRDNLKDTVVVARELNLFDIYALTRDKVAGIVQEGGGRTTHTTIMIRALELPAIIGVPRILQKVKTDDMLVANGLTGEIILNPEQKTLKRCIKKRNNFKIYEQQYLRVAGLPSVTHDKKQFVVSANIELCDEADSVIAHGEFGIGLFRTEYLFMAEDKLPTEEEQYEKYMSVVKKIHPLPVTIRTIDLGGDKIVPFLETESEKNPFLGWRAIRMCLDMPDIFKKQLRAILRASVLGNVKLMLPLITSLEEIYSTKSLIEEVKTELQSQNIDFDPNIPIGIMIEVPSAVMLADQLAKEVDFFSIGTNDLVQYTLAVDRGNARVANLFNFFHPAVLRMIRATIQAANKQNIPVGMCGEMAGEPLAVLLLFGLGITEFSVSPVMSLKIKQILRSIKFTEAEKISRHCMRLHTVGEIERYLRSVMNKLFPRMDEDNFFRRTYK